MTEMVERVARAIASHVGYADDDWFKYGPAARAAIAAMREPTEEMLKAAYAKAFDKEIWQAMIDAALSE